MKLELKKIKGAFVVISKGITPERFKVFSELHLPCDTWGRIDAPLPYLFFTISNKNRSYGSFTNYRVALNLNRINDVFKEWTYRFI